MDRQPLSKKIRFEIFKRDSFTCQYCGRSAPEIVLQVDHIEPVSKGGQNDISNLITSCFDCNSGKRDRRLSDDSVIQKQKAQCDELQYRREQIEMMMDWQKGLIDLESQQAKMAADLFEELTEYEPNEYGLKTLKRLCFRYSFQEVLEAMRISVSQYAKQGESDVYSQESVSKAFNYIEKICRSKKNLREKPYLKDVYYIRGILKNRLGYLSEYVAADILEAAFLKGRNFDELKKIAIESKNWTDWKARMEVLNGEAQID